MKRDAVAVFGSSQTPPSSSAYRTARELGRELARLGAEIRCGGYSGVMAGVAAGGKEAGGRVVGCTIGWFADTRTPCPDLTETQDSQDLHARVQCLLQGARSAIALSGGIGTFNELFWVWTLLLHRRKDAPGRLVLLDGPWDELLDFLDRRFEFGEAARKLVHVARTPSEAAEIAWNG
jgi:uncharacterized protein (TIGR00730 family)